MPLRLYNTLTRTIEPFVPIEPGHARVYVCGLTPSAEAHLGHARSFLFFDVLRRLLVARGYRVTYVRNVTDVDDRSIAAARERGVAWTEIVEEHYESFRRSMSRMHVLEPDHEPRATRYVPQIVEMIGKLVERDDAYVVEDGVYFSVASFPRYGRLSGRKTDELLVGARIAPDERKHDPLDFALWKFSKPGEPQWPSPWGAGRPGWHIECSAMIHALLGEPVDIHGGGYDLVFPHHENEIAQTESLYEAPMVRYWMHGGLLMFDGRKMSKSLGNFEPLSALLDRHDPQAIRMLFLQTGYRKPMNFTEASIDAATAGLDRLFAAYDALRTAPPANVSPAAIDLARYRARFDDALDDDVNTAGALSVLFDLAHAAGRPDARGQASATAALLHQGLTLLGLAPNERAPRPAGARGAADEGVVERLRAALADVVRLEPQTPPAVAIETVVAAREQARARRDYALADRLRVALAEAGVDVRDRKASNGA